MIKVIFEGFNNIEQAKTFVDWYGGAGEQGSEVWLEEHSDLQSATVDYNKGLTITDNEIIVPLNTELK